MLGVREKQLYGENTYKQLVAFIKQTAKEIGVRVKIFQSNSEGRIIDVIQRAVGKYNGIVINAGAYTHTSIAIMDALKCLSLPIVEVHITDIFKREEFRKNSYISEVAAFTVCGKGFQGYADALKFIAKN